MRNGMDVSTVSYSGSRLTPCRCSYCQNVTTRSRRIFPHLTQGYSQSAENRNQTHSNGAHMTTLKTLIRDYLAKRACREMWKE
jgi:pyruvate-formate lyase-activating enzyme